MQVQDVYVVSACRTPIGKFMGALKDVSARELAIAAAQEAILRAGIDAELIDEIAMGQLYTAMQGSLPARQVGLRVGLPNRSSAVSINQNCSSSMRALEVASHSIMLGKNDTALVVGVESMTNAPYLLPKARMGYKMNAGTIEDHMIHDGLYDELVPGHMGITAENIAKKYGITRVECDELAFESHKRAIAAIEDGRFKKEIVPIEIKSRRGSTFFEEDEHPIRDVNMGDFSKLSPVFDKNGVVTAGNASGINDGASAVVIMSASKVQELGIKPLMKLVNICTQGTDPKLMGLGPAYVIPKCLQQAHLKYEDVDYWEINEAFASQWLGVGRALKEDSGLDISMDKVNHNGSGIALGHPVGSTGLRIIVSLYYEMERLDLALGGASLCVGGGPAMASLWTREF